MVMCTSNNFNDLDKLRDLPQEIVYEIFKWVPEYGHGVCKDLHERSLDTIKVSAYCDFYRYCVRSVMGPLNTCIEIMADWLPDAITVGARKYLSRNVPGLLFKYLHEQYDTEEDGIGPIICGLLEDFGIKHVRKLSNMGNLCRNHLVDLYISARWTKEYVNFYVLMILLDSEVITKKEFDRRMKIVDLRTVLQSLVYMQNVQDHISCLAVRYFGHVIPEICLKPDKLCVYGNDRDNYAKFVKIIESPFYTGIGKYTRIEQLINMVPEHLEGFSDQHWSLVKATYILDAIRHMPVDCDRE